MNSVLSWLPADSWQRLLVDALWQSTVIGAIGWLVACFLVRQVAAKSWVLLLTVTSCLLAPLASVAARQGGIALFDGATQEVAATASSTSPAPSTLSDSDLDKIDGPQFISVVNGAESVAPEVHPSPNPAEVPPAFSAVGQKIEASKPNTDWPLLKLYFFDWIGLAWLAASGLLVVRLAVGCAGALRLIRQAQPCNDDTLLRAVEAARERLTLKTRPMLLVSSHISTPMVLAIGRPRLLIPEIDRTVDWTPAFTHELAHVARGDGWSRLWVEFVAIALPLSPLVWLLRRSFRIACEEACDDWVIATGTEPSEYVSALASWINRPRRVVPLPAIGMSTTKSRLLRLLSLRERPVVKNSRFKRIACATVALVLIAGLAVAQTKSSRPEYTVPPTKSIQQRIEDKPPADPPEEVGQNAIANDPLLPLYGKRMAEYEELLTIEKAKLADLKAGKPNSDGSTEEWLRNEIQRYEEAIKSYKERIEKRKAELRSRTNEEVKEKQATKSPLPPYDIEPPDVITIDAISLVPKKPFRLAPADKVKLAVEGTRLDAPISGTFQVDSTGEIVLGPSYGSVKIAGLTRVEAQEAVTEQLKETLVNPQVALIIDEARLTSGITGQHLVGPDGMVNLGIYGSAYVAGCTIPEACRAIEKQLAGAFREPKVSVDIYAYNSKVYYVISTGERGDNIQRFPITGHETILDAIAQVKGAGDLASKNIWIARPKPIGEDQNLRFQWDQISAGDDSTNYQVLPGDRIFIAEKDKTERPEPRPKGCAAQFELDGQKSDESRSP